MLRSLLLHLDDHPSAPARVDAAIRLARRFDAHLVGLSAVGRIPTSLGFGTGSLLGPALDGLREAARHRAQAFAAQCRAAGLVSVETVLAATDAREALVSHAHCSDLVLLSQATDGDERALVEEVVLQSARPTLIWPHSGAPATLGERVLVGWNDSPESARALTDALPLLCRAQQVVVMQCDTPLDAAPTEPARQRLEALRRWLMWHGVEAEVRLETSPIDVGHELLCRAADLGADLLVMGAWGRPRWAERVLGGATRTLLNGMTLPVLMSH